MKQQILFISALILVSVVAVTVRTTDLATNPSILNRDEAALAYNALLIQQTGLDEWQQSANSTLKSFGDYKLIGYPLLLVILFNFFEPSDLIVRAPAVVAGILLVLLSASISWKLFRSKATTIFFMLTIATSPIFIFFSRMAWEATVGLTLFLSGVLLLFWSKAQTRKQYLVDVLGLILIVAACFTYNTPLILLVFLLLPLTWYKSTRTNKQSFIIPLLAALFTVFLLTYFLQLGSQKGEILLFNDGNLHLQSIEWYQRFPSPLNSVIGNEYVFYLIEIGKRFIASFSPHFLVTTGGTHPWHALPGWSHLYWPTYLLGIYGLVLTIVKVIVSYSRTRKASPTDIFLLYALVTSLLPSIITTDSPHATRSLLFVYIFCLFSIIGLHRISNFVKARYRNLSFFIPGIYCVLISVNTVNYMKTYLLAYPKQQTIILKSGFDTAIQEVTHKRKKNPVVVIDSEGYHYILAAWYLKTSPETFFKSIKREGPDTIGLFYGKQLDGITFVRRLEDRDLTKQAYIVEFKDGNWTYEYR